MKKTRYQSWGRLDAGAHEAVQLGSRKPVLPETDGRPLLPFGNGRSYGDSCHSAGGVLLDCRGMNRLIGFDEERGVIACEAGMLLADILRIIVPAGWFLPVTPGTKFVTLGGAIANDVHGKNHHVRGTFGRYVECFELLRSDGTRRTCSRNNHGELFAATIGGMGLTGLVTWAEIKLIPIESDRIDQDVIRFYDLEEFADLSAASEYSHEYSVAWIDSLSKGRHFGRGLFIRGNHAKDDGKALKTGRSAKLSVPFTPPVPLLNRASLTAFNTLNWRKQFHDRKKTRVHYDPFFYPLDGIRHWNRLYGPQGLYQHQSLIPMNVGIEAVTEMLERSQRAGQGSFLTVLKAFGDVCSPGLLSFPRPGLTLTLDFANRGAPTLALLDELDAVVKQAGGRVCPYKDARMSAESFQAFFPEWRELEPHIDPAFGSSFWRRVTRQVRADEGWNAEGVRIVEKELT